MLSRFVLLFSTVLCLIAVPPASAQISTPYAAGFGSSGHEEMRDMCIDPGGSYVFTFSFEQSMTVAGGTNFPRTLNSNGLQDNGIARFDFLGNVQWALSWGNAGGDEHPVAVACAADSSIYVLGRFTGILDANPQPGTSNLTSAGESDVYLIKLDPAGNFAWAQRFGGEGADEAAAITTDQDGNLLVTILYEDEIDADPNAANVSLLTSAGGKDIAFLKLRPNGTLIWAKAIGGNMDDGTAGIATLIDNAGNIIMAGTFRGSADLDPGVAPATFTSSGEHDVFLARFTPEGNLFRARQIGGIGNIEITNDSLGMDDVGNVYLAGTFRQSIDVDPSFVSRTYTAQQNSSDMFVASYTRDDALRWSFQLGGLANENVNTLRVNRNGILTIAGDFQGAIDLDPGSGQLNVLARGFNGASDGFAAKFRAETGTFVWGFSFGSAISGAEQATTVVSSGLDTMGNLVLAGNFFGTNTDFDPSAEATVLGSLGGSDLFLAAYNWEGKLRTPSTEITKPVLRASTNGGSFVPGGVVPGELATLFGLGMTTKIPGIPTPATAPGGVFPIGTRLCNAEVIFTDPDTAEEFKAPILFCSQFQVNYQVPTELPVDKYVRLRIVVDEVASNDLEMQVKPNDIGLFMENFQQRIGALTFAFGVRRGEKMNFSNTVTACDILEIYVTGLGNVAGGLPDDGTPATSAQAALGSAKVVLYDDGTKGFIPTAPRFVELTAQNGYIQYTGVAPFFVGLYQVNMEWPNPQDSTIPRNLILFQGDYPAYVEFNGRRSQTFVIPIRYSAENPSPCRVL